jgi:hypothetical protein
MPINVNGTILTGGTSLTATDASTSNVLYRQNTTGVVSKPTNSAGTIVTQMFNVGMGTGAWVALGGVVIFSYTGGSGYLNVNGCYSTSTGAFTAPFTGLYLFKHHIYCYGPNATVGWYFHPLYLVNGNQEVRRPGGTPYRMRQYGLNAEYGQDSDCCELIYLLAGDYVQVYTPRNGDMQGYEAFSTFNGSYISN